MPKAETIKTLQDQWREYRDACYPTGCPADQNRECHQAFFAGALVVLKLAVENAANADPKTAYDRTVDLINEAEAVCRNRIYAMKGVN